MQRVMSCWFRKNGLKTYLQLHHILLKAASHSKARTSQTVCDGKETGNDRLGGGYSGNQIPE